jgi:hypothetical protein
VEADCLHDLGSWWGGYEDGRRESAGVSAFLLAGCHAIEAWRWFAYEREALGRIRRGEAGGDLAAALSRAGLPKKAGPPFRVDAGAAGGAGGRDPAGDGRRGALRGAGADQKVIVSPPSTAITWPVM